MPSRRLEASAELEPGRKVPIGAAGDNEVREVIIDGYSHSLPDIDPSETREWVDSLDSVVDQRGRPRARFLLARLMARARELHVGVPAMVSSDYINTIP